jgi:putative hemolysin
VQLVLELTFVLLLFAVGLRLSAFFSGGETGFYRLSLPRVSIDAQAGDRVSQQLLWFARHPAYFVATTLVGNNLANYVTTFAISLGVATVFGSVTELLDVGSTLLLAPVIFLFGELLPKNLYYRAPMSLLRRDATLFRMFYYLFLPLSWPLVRISILLERFNQQAGPRANVMLGRSRLVQLMSQGRQEGLLTDVQTRLASGVLQTAPQRVADSMIPVDRVLGLAATASREEIAKFARSYGTPIVCLRRAGTEDEWHAYIRAVDVALDSRPISALIQEMPVIDPKTSKLDALQQLQTAGALQGVVIRNGKTLGVVSNRGLVEQLFRPMVVATP